MSAGDLSAQARISCDSSSRNCASVISGPVRRLQLVIAANGAEPRSAVQQGPNAVIVAYKHEGLVNEWVSRRWRMPRFHVHIIFGRRNVGAPARFQITGRGS